ncbi:MAG: integrase family protein [Rubrivivax sp.]|nr:integrase family protein [Rubrivivax sp.]
MSAYNIAYMRDLRMHEKTGRLTERRALDLPVPATGYKLHWCPSTAGFGVRVTAAGGRSWVCERRINGRTVRRTLGQVSGRGAVSADAARKQMIVVNGELQNGVDRMVLSRAARVEKRKAATDAALTLDVALRAYVRDKRRGKDGLPLKERTRADYLAMLEPGGLNEQTGHTRQPGELHALAAKPLSAITGDDVRATYRAALKRGDRRATYAMQVLRAVLNWHGVAVPDNPLGREVAGRERIVLKPTRGRPSPIPPERLAAWWKAANNAGKGAGQIGGSAAAADACMLLLLTGCRPGELLPGPHSEGIKLGDVDLTGGRIVLKDTKNRGDHVVYLSRQAAQIVARHAAGKKRGDVLFPIEDVGKTLQAINAAAGVSGVTAHKLRHTFASIAEELVSAGSLKAMLNHTPAGDVTHAHYVGKSQGQLRAAWQAVADFIEGAT